MPKKRSSQSGSNSATARLISKINRFGQTAINNIAVEHANEQSSRRSNHLSYDDEDDEVFVMTAKRKQQLQRNEFLESLTKEQLKSEAKRRGLKTAGTKTELVVFAFLCCRLARADFQFNVDSFITFSVAILMIFAYIFGLTVDTFFTESMMWIIANTFHTFHHVDLREQLIAHTSSKSVHVMICLHSTLIRWSFHISSTLDLFLRFHFVCTFLISFLLLKKNHFFVLRVRFVLSWLKTYICVSTGTFLSYFTHEFSVLEFVVALKIEIRKWHEHVWWNLEKTQFVNQWVS